MRIEADEDLQAFNLQMEKFKASVDKLSIEVKNLQEDLTQEDLTPDDVDSECWSGFEFEIESALTKVKIARQDIENMLEFSYEEDM